MRRYRLPFLVLALVLPGMVGVPVSAQAPWVGFDDVPPSNIFFDDIRWLAEQGITRGCNPPANTKFCPADPVTRGQMAAFLARALDLPEPDQADRFRDDDGSIFEADIDRLAAAGVTAGCNPPDNSKFCPDDHVTRAQMASFLVRALGLDAGAGIDWFRDDDLSVHHANVDRLRAAWITFGCNPPTENRFCPNQNVTRQQMAAFLHRALEQPSSGAAIGVHGYTWPETLYVHADIVGTFEVRNVGSIPLSDVTAGPYTPEGEDYPWGDCVDPKFISGPAERLGNGDELLDPGEIWDWYCSLKTHVMAHTMYLEATGTADGSDFVSSWGKVEYTLLYPIEMAATASATSVEAGEEVTWTITLENVSPVRCTDVEVEARKNATGPSASYTEPNVEVVGNGDQVMDPGEVWRYEHTETLWVDTFLDVGAVYAPDYLPFAWTGIPGLQTAVVKVVTPS